MGDPVKDPKPIEIPPQPIDVPLEPKGTPIQIKGVIEDFWQGTAIVAIPNGGGGTLGVWTGIDKGKIGDPAVVQGTVDDSARDAIAVKFPTFGNAITPAGEQLVTVSRFKAFPDTKTATGTVTATEDVTP